MDCKKTHGNERIVIVNNLNMGTTKIKVSNYYGKPAYYSVMPQQIFELLEAAHLNGEEHIEVSTEQFDQMVIDYKLKMDIK